MLGAREGARVAAMPPAVELELRCAAVRVGGERGLAG